ncbi:MAG: exonuclease SbcCD subunit D [Deltaproteobacteria bacterium]|nr:MAG: exonuclease SbcCD subunit D [Deltaproteobacteria bacterium]TNF30888.1 MAG: exonuclease SbcCD subunit D [Deltaproteobacteria bacterium]
MSLKIIHTGDWHLGKKLFKTSRLPEQELFLTELKTIILNKDIDALLIAGDIFDTPYPPSDAIKLLIEFLYDVTTTSKCHIYFISGNHDSGRFLETVAPFYREKNIHVVGDIRSRSPEKFCFEISNGIQTASLFMLPFFRSFDLITLGKENYPELETLRDESISEYLLMVLKRLFDNFSSSHLGPKILMTHHLFAGYEASESEQGVGLSGLDQIPLSILTEFFDYVALGHLHKKQTLSEDKPKIIYPGSPIPFRFSETTQKYLSFIEINNDRLSQEFIELSTYRKLHRIRCKHDELDGKLEELIKNDDDISSLSSLLEVNVKLDEPFPGLADIIRDKLTDSNIELVSFNSFVENAKAEQSSQSDYHLLTTEDLFKQFYSQKFSKECPEDIYKEFQNLLNIFREQSEQKGMR